MLRNRFIIGVVLLALLGAIAGCGVGSEQAPETASTLTIQGRVVVDAYHYDEATGEYVQFYHHESENLLTTIGIDWIAAELGGDSPTTISAQWISLDETLDGGPVVGWTQLVSEIASGGLTRASGTYAHTGGANTWTIAATFNASATHTDVQVSGLQWAASGDNNLLAANTFTAVTLNDGDALTVTWELTIS